MNRIYRLVFNHALGQIQVTSEIGSSPSATTGATRHLPARLRLLPLALALAYAGGAQAVELPQSGSASGAAISYGSAGTNTMTITQAQAKALITWGSFNIGEGGTVDIFTPGASSVTLNVVNGGTLSSIDGVLKSNGQVFLINPAGIAFGGTAQVNVAGLLASSLALSQDDDRGNYVFAQSGAAAGVRNAGGQINSSGPVVLIGASVSNSGSIVGSTVNLLSAGGVTLQYNPVDGATAVLGAASNSLPGGTSAAVSNTGTIMANRIVLQANLVPSLAASAINLGGAVVATQLEADAVGGGLRISGDVTADTIRLSGDKSVSQSAGKLIARAGLELAVTGDATLSSAANQVARIGGAVSGNLALSNTVALTQTGALEVAGTTTLNNASKDVMLTNAGNRFGGNVSLAAGNVAISAAGSLALGNVQVDSLNATAGSIHLPAVISSAGGQSYNGAVVLGQNTSLSSTLGSITFGGGIDGGHALAATAGLNVFFAGAVGSSTALTSLDVSGEFGISLQSNVTTTGRQRYGGALNLGGATSLTSQSAGAIDFSSTINGAHGLTVNTAGATTFAGAIGGITALASLTTDATGTTRLGGNVRTTGSQTYGDTVSLSGPVTLSSAAAGNIAFGRGVTGTSDLTVNTAGQTAFAGAVNLGSLTTDAGGSTKLGGDVTTSGAQVYGDELALAGDVTLTSRLGDSISINAGANGGHALTVNTAGTTTLAGGFGSTTALASFATGAGGTTRLTGVFHTLGDQTYGDNVVLVGGSMLSSSAGSIGFGGTLDGAYSLTTSAAEGTEFSGAVGAMDPLASLAVSAGWFNAQGITTTGNLSLNVSNGIFQAGAYHVGGDASFASDGRLMLTDVANLFNGKVALDGTTVSINASTALDISRTQATMLVAQALGGLTLDDASIGSGGAILGGSVVSLGSITVTDGAGLGVSGSSINQFRALDVSGASTFAAGAGNITLGALNKFGGRVNLDGGNILINARNLLTLGSVSASNLEARASQLQLTSNITTTGYQRYVGALGLTRDTSLEARGDIDIAGSIDGKWGLALKSDVAVRIAGDVGQSTALSSLTVSGPAAIDSAVTTGGAQVFNGALQLNGDSNLTSLQGDITMAGVDGAHALALSALNGTVRVGSIGASSALTSLQVDSAALGLLGTSVTTSGAQRYNAPVLMTQNAILASTGGGDIGFGGSIDGGFALQVNTAGVTRFGGTIGGGAALASLTTDAAGTTELGGGITASGNVAFNDAVNLKALTSVRSQNGTTTFGNTVIGPWALTATGGAGTTFGGAVDVQALQVQGGGITSLGGDVHAEYSAIFGRPVWLTADVTVDAGSVSFAGAINGAHALDITASGAVIIGDHVGATSALDSLAVRGASLNAKGITTTGSLSVDVAAAITQAAAYSVGGAASFASQGNITLSNSVNRFDGVVSLDGGAVQIASASAIDLDVVQTGSLSAIANGRLRLGNATIGGNTTLMGTGIVFDDATIQGNLGAVSGGFIQQSGALNVAGTSQLNADGEITLRNGQNAFGGALALSGTTIGVESASDLLVTQLHNGANSGVSLVSGKGLSLTGNDVDTGTANLTLAANGGQLVTQVALAGTDLDLQGSQGIALSGNVSAAGAGTFTSTNSDIVQTSGRTQVGGVTRISAGTGRIGFGNSNNLFNGAVHLSGGAATIRSTGLLMLDGPAVRSLDAAGSAGLDVADMVVAENATLAAGSGALTANNVDIGGNLGASGASITQTGALVVDGAATLRSAGSISVSDAVLGSLDATAGNALTISNSIAGNTTLSANGIVFDDVAIRGDLGAVSDSSILQSARLDVTGNSQLSAIGNVKLDNGQNAFGGVVSVRATNASIISSSALLLGTSEVGYLGARTTGDLRLTGQITADSVDLSTDGVFDNRYGANAIQLNGNGRWNIYLKSPTSPHAFGNLDSANSAIWNTAAFAGTTASGNRYLFAWQPTLTVQASILRKIYGDTLRLDNAYSVSGAMAGVVGAYNADVVADLIAGAPLLSSAGAAGAAGVSSSPYQIDINQGSLNTGISGYALTFVGGQLSIDPRTLTITANSVGKTYGQIGNFNGFSSDVLVNGDTLTGVDLASNGSAATANVGNYTITASNAVGTGLSNYDITYVDGTLSIGKAGLTITAGNGSKTYGQSGGFNGFSGNGLLNSDTLTGVDLASNGSAATANVGNYTITASNADGTGLSNYDITYVDGTLSIGKAGLTITAGNGSKTYGQSGGFNGFSGKGLLNSDTLTGVDLTSTGSAATANVGNYTITASNADGTGLSNYDITYVDGTLSIGKAGLTITAGNGSKTYGQSGGFNGFSENGLVNGDTLTGVDLASTGSAATANVGNYTITASNADGTGLSNYDITYVDGTLNIGKAGLTITANNGGKTYGQSGGFNGFSGNGLLNSDTLTGVDLASNGSAATANVGNYTITASNADGTGLSNYDITYVDGTLSIGKAGLTITAGNGSKTYGQSGGFNGFSGKGLLNSDTLTGVDLTSTGSAATANVGNYTITASNADGTGLSNYDITYVDGTLSIGKAGLTITAGNGSKTYGQSGGFNGFSENGLLNGDTLTGVDLASNGSAATANVGNYTITASNADGTGLSNYDITYVDGTLNIGKAGLTITANNGGKTYGQSGGFNGFSGNGLLNSDTLTGVDLTSNGSAATANVGNYTITASNADGTGLSNYDITYVDGTLSIGKAGLTITAGNGSKTYGQSGGFNGFSSNGLLNSDTLTGVDLTSNGSAATANVGNYTITASNADGTGLSNYDITYVNGNLSIGKAGLTITANNGGKTYGQTGGFAGFSSNGLLNSDTLTGVDLTSSGSAATANVGNYTITASNADGTGLSNYDITYVDGTLSIGKAGLTITAGNGSKTYGQSGGFNGFSENGLVNGDTLTGVDLASNGSAATANVGNYTITASNADGTGLSNYDITYVDGTLKIGKAGLTITANNGGKTYGQTGGFAGFSSNGLFNSDTVSSVDLSSNGSAATANVGNYTITASNADGTGLSNYDITYVDGTLSIGKAGLTITAGNGSKTYGQSGGFNGFSGNGLLNSDTLTGVDLTSNGSAATANVGNYTITASNADGTGLSNYDITYVDGTLSIGKAGLTITAGNGSKTYGQSGGFNGFSGNGLLNSDTLTGVDLTSNGSAATANVGNYTITASNADGTGLSNYDITYVDGTLSIGKAGLTITAGNGSKTYGQSGGFNGFSGNGLLNSDTLTGVDLTSNGSAATANVGNYTITASNADGTGLSNYDITYVDGTLSIGKAGLTITAGNGSKTYGQSGGFNGFSGNGLLNSDTLTGVDLASNGSAATANVGNYTITASNADGTGLSNYDITYVDGTLSIGKAGLTITANNISKRIGQLLALDGYSSSGLLNGDTIDSVSLFSHGNNVNAQPGVYAILASDARGAQLHNYDISYQDGNLQVFGVMAEAAGESARAVVVGRNDAPPVSRPSVPPTPSSTGTGITLPRGICTQLDGMDCLSRQPE